MHTKRPRLWGLLGVLLGLSAFQAPAALAAPPQFTHTWSPTTGHTDAFFFDPITTPGMLKLHVESDALGNIELDDTLFVANDTKYSDEAPGHTKFQLTGAHPVLGGKAGDTVWILPADFTEFSPGYNRKQPEVSAANGWSAQTLILNSVAEPSPTARLAIWSSSGTVRFSATGDTTTPQTWNTGNPAHGHMNWGFTQPGLYVLSFTGQITGPAGTLTSTRHLVHFCVIGETGANPATLESVCGISQGGGGGGGGPESSVAITAKLESCGLALSVAANTTSLTGTTTAGGLQTLTGTLPTVSVISCQAQAWSIRGIASDFTSSAGSFSASRLGWTPKAGTEDLGGRAQAGPSVAPGPNPTDGLKVSRVLGVAAGGPAVGTAQFGAALTLSVPLSTPAGAYTSTLTLTAIGGAD
jgi:surface-anchored protein